MNGRGPVWADVGATRRIPSLPLVTKVVDAILDGKVPSTATPSTDAARPSTPPWAAIGSTTTTARDGRDVFTPS